MSNQHFCHKCGFIGTGNPVDTSSIQTPDHLSQHNILTLHKYEWIMKGVWNHLFIIGNKQFAATSHEELLKQMNTGAVDVFELNEAGELTTKEQKDVEACPTFHTCPDCDDPTILIDVSLAKEYGDKVLYLLLEHGITGNAPRKMIEEFGASLIPDKYKYQREFPMGAAIHGIVHGDNKNDIYKWLYGSGLMTGDDNQALLRYASIQKRKTEERIEAQYELIRQILNNDAEWKDLDIPYDGYERIMKAIKDDEQLYKDMTKYHFKRTILTGNQNG